MSAASSILNTLREVPTAGQIKSEHEIKLIDHTKPPSINEPSAEEDGSETPSAAAPGTPLFKRLTNNSLSLQESVRQQINKQKYARYGRDRYTDSTEDTPAQPPDEDSRNAPQEGEEASPTQVGYLERSRAKAKSMLKRKRTMGRGQETRDTVIDVLYENQRGWFLFGVPRYSSASLLPSDPRPWQNADFRTSPVDIRNAQPPDPSWEWAWKSWYVDMSRDVDEEGWEYSFLFRKEFSWHGNHPWFHSFVRRRRWLRMRRRKAEAHKTKEKSHELTAEYFTIHPKTLKPSSDAVLSAGSRRSMRKEEDIDIEKTDITDIASLMLVLRKAKVDREKLVAVHKFIDGGGEELYYLSQRMPEIMSLFIYQSSRRQLLADLTGHHDEAHGKREDLASHSHADDEKQKQHDTDARYAENLHAAVQAADAQVKKLEYWSDIKGMAENDELLHSDRFKDGGGHMHESFANKQDAREGAPKLHSHAEHPSSSPEDSGPSKQSSKSTFSDAHSTSAGPSVKESKSTFYDAQSTPAPPSKAPSKEALGKSPESSDDGASMDRYTTAAESVGESEGPSSPSGKAMSPAQKGKEKAARLSSLDGVMEEERELPDQAKKGQEGDDEEKDGDEDEEGGERADGKSRGDTSAKPDHGIGDAITMLMKGGDGDADVPKVEDYSDSRGITSTIKNLVAGGEKEGNEGDHTKGGEEVETKKLEDDGDSRGITSTIKNLITGGDKTEEDEGDVVEEENSKSP